MSEAQAGSRSIPAPDHGSVDLTARDALTLLDGHALFHRAFHAFPDEMSTASGEATNAVFGFTRILLDIYRYVRPGYVAVAFDRPTPTFRHRDYEPYKAHRPSLPDSMRAQFPRVREIVQAFNIPIYELDGFEADDVLGTLARQANNDGVPVVIATGDLDTIQLVNDMTRVTFARSPRRGDFEYYDVAAVEARYGFAPLRIVDYKALVGDTSDNIPGVPGIGQKTATKLIQDYGTLEAILEHVDDLSPRVRAALIENRDLAVQSKFLATIVLDAPISLDLQACRALDYNPERVLDLFRQLEFFSLVDRLPRKADVITPAQKRSKGSVASLAHAPDDAAAQLSLFEESELEAIAESGVTELAGGPITVAPKLATTDGKTNTLTIDSPEALSTLSRALLSAPLFSFDLETDSQIERYANIVGLSFSMGEAEAYYIPVGHDPSVNEGTRQLPLAQVLESLRPALTNRRVAKIGHNAKFDMMVLAMNGIWVDGLAFDTMVAAYLLYPGRRGLGLKDLSFESLNVIMTPITELIGTGKNQITMAQTPIAAAAAYAGADADMTLRLYHTLRPQIAARELMPLMTEVETPLIPVLARMELAGILIDPDFLRRMATELDEQLTALVTDIYEAVGHQFNVNSTKQLGEVLYDELKLPPVRRTKTGYSVDADSLETLRGAHSAVDSLLEHRQLAKLKSTYVDGLLELMDPKTRRVHTSFNQTIAATGRLSSSNPNLQNIPVRTEVGRRIRRAFLADPGSVLLTADYSQIELRILAHITGEPGLVAAFEADEDIHAATAAQLFHVALEEVTTDQRRLAKTVNFALLYGQSAFGLARVTGMSNSEAAEFIRNYEKTFPRVRQYVEDTLFQARTRGYVQTLLGRKRYLPDMAGLQVAQRQAAEREAINMPIQGTNADMIKIAMIHLDDALRARGLRSRMILQVHDELVLETPDDELDVVSGLVRSCMIEAITLRVPVKVDMKTGRNWYDVEPLRAK
ncbi:MAG TPA: DNA polymerase I [Ktedonobacterales bacterium]